MDTAVAPRGDGRYHADVSRDWEIWGPMGGYVAAIALRAAGAERPDDRPVAFSCHYLRSARFAPVELAVTTRKAGRSATAQRVELSQDGEPVLDAMVWSAGSTDGLEHDESEPPVVAHPDELPEIRELLPDDAPAFPFWENFQAKPLDFEHQWPPDGPRPARWREWLRFVPTSTFPDPWLDGARTVILVDLPSWPSANRPHAWTQPPFIAPTLDLNVAFHRPSHDHDWLLCDGAAPVSTGGVFGWNAAVWSTAGTLLASGGGQCLYRRVRG